MSEDVFYGGEKPITKHQVNDELDEGDYEIGYSEKYKQPLYSAEIVTKSEADTHVKRHSDFRPDPQLPENERESLADYRGSGYDRGHLVSSADSDSREEQHETFVLSNMVPEVHAMNAGIWAKIEGHVRDLTDQDGDIYAVTGAIYNQADIVKGNLTVPPFVYKCVTIPSIKVTGVYVAPNDKSGTYELYSEPDFYAKFGIDPQPGSGFPLDKEILEV